MNDNVGANADAICSVNVGIARCRAYAILPTYATLGSLAMDFYAAENVTIPPRGAMRVPTGVTVKLPPYYGLWLLARSSTWAQYKLMLTNSVGLVDCDYCGPDDEVCFSYVNLGSYGVTLVRGARIGQGLLVPRVRACLIGYDSSEVKSRGGFGSTGA